MVNMFDYVADQWTRTNIFSDGTVDVQEWKLSELLSGNFNETDSDADADRFGIDISG